MFLPADSSHSALNTQFPCSTLKKILKVIFYLSLFINVDQSSGQFPIKREASSPDLSVIPLEEIKLVEKEAGLIPGFPEGFEMAVRRFNESQDATLFASVHMPDHVLRHSGADDEGKEVVILQSDPEKVSFKNVSTFIVLKLVAHALHRYSTHLAYTRHFGKQVSVEWDLYSFHFHKNNDSFVQAFIPVRQGPSTLTLGLGYTLTRSRRGDEDKDIPDPSKKLDSPSNSEMKDGSNVDQARPKKLDSSDEDLLKLDVPFVGIGDCNFLSIDFNSPLPEDQIELIGFFLNILKAQCSSTIMKQTLKLFEYNLVIFSGPTDIRINRKNSFFQKKILGEMEWIDFASAVLLSKFSQVFGEQHVKFNLNKTDNKAPNDKRISGTLRTLTILTTRILDSVQSTEKLHAIKFANLLLVILQAQRSELVTGADELVKCIKCEAEKEVNFNDQVQLYALMRFIVDKLPSIVTSNSKTEEMFNSFFTKNVLLIIPFVKNKIPFSY